jgi:hypothetical protein
MILNKDNYELVMFDLLEGNLSEADELRVMEQIEGDDFLFREWKLFKTTVLIADKDVEYNGKAGLLKKEASSVPMFTRWAAIAASVCILAAAVVFWPKSSVTPLATFDVSPNPIEAPKPSDTASDEGITPVTEYPEEIERTNIPAKTKTVPFIAENSHPMPEQLGHNFVHEKNHERAVPVIEFDSGRNDVVVKNIPTENKKEEKPITPQVPKNEVIVADNNKPEKLKPLTKREKAIAFVTKNPPSRIKEKAIGILALISNPKLKISPNFKDRRPSLEIELETTGYQAIASIQPFRNRN